MIVAPRVFTAHAAMRRPYVCPSITPSRGTPVTQTRQPRTLPHVREPIPYEEGLLGSALEDCHVAALFGNPAPVWAPDPQRKV